MKYYFACPKCQRDDSFSVPLEESSGLGCLLLFLGGFIPALLYASAQQHRIQCDNCGYIFRQPCLQKTGVAKLVTAILLIYLAAAVSAVVLLCLPDLASKIATPEFLQDLPPVVSENLGVFAMLVLITYVVTALICLFASASSSAAYKLKLARKMAIRPKPRSGLAERKGDVAVESDGPDREREG